MIIDGYCTLGVDREYDLTEKTLLEAMDQAEVERALIAAVDRFLAVDNGAGNDFLLRAAASHLDRFIPSCTVSPWLGEGGLAELRRALGEGARLLVLNPAIQGFLANDELVWPFLEVAAEEKIPVYFHTGNPGSATPWQVVDLAERYPSVDLIIGHCGATDFWNDMVEAARAAPTIHLEASLARPFLFDTYMQQVGYHKGIMGSSAPLNELVFEWVQMRGTLPSEAVAEVCGLNLLRLLEKRGAL